MREKERARDTMREWLSKRAMKSGGMGSGTCHSCGWVVLRLFWMEATSSVGLKMRLVWNGQGSRGANRSTGKILWAET